MPWKKLNKKQLQLQAKPWITTSILASMKRRDKLLQKWITAKDPLRKELIRTEYKTLRNKVTYIISISKKITTNSFLQKILPTSRKHGQELKV